MIRNENATKSALYEELRQAYLSNQMSFPQYEVIFIQCLYTVKNEQIRQKLTQDSVYFYFLETENGCINNAWFYFNLPVAEGSFGLPAFRSWH